MRSVRERCMFVCMCVYIYIYIYIDIHTYRLRGPPPRAQEGGLRDREAGANKKYCKQLTSTCRH